MSAALIKQSMTTAVLAITPLLNSDERFREFDASQDYLAWCEQNPAAALRRVLIRDTGTLEPPAITNTDVEWVATEFEVAVCYPRESGTSNERDELIASDMRQIRATIGVAGYATHEDAADATVTELGVSREETEACVFGVLRLRVEFFQAMA